MRTKRTQYISFMLAQLQWLPLPVSNWFKMLLIALKAPFGPVPGRRCLRGALLVVPQLSLMTNAELTVSHIWSDFRVFFATFKQKAAGVCASSWHENCQVRHQTELHWDQQNSCVRRHAPLIHLNETSLASGPAITWFSFSAEHHVISTSCRGFACKCTFLRCMLQCRVDATE